MKKLFNAIHHSHVALSGLGFLFYSLPRVNPGLFPVGALPLAIVPSYTPGEPLPLTLYLQAPAQ